VPEPAEVGDDSCRLLGQTGCDGAFHSKPCPRSKPVRNPAQEEWKNADEVCTQILSASGAVADWDRLLEPFPFFTAFRNYLQVAPAPNIARHRMPSCIQLPDSSENTASFCSTCKLCTMYADKGAAHAARTNCVRRQILGSFSCLHVRTTASAAPCLCAAFHEIHEEGGCPRRALCCHEETNRV
jgi:hypothetical protein